MNSALLSTIAFALATVLFLIAAFGGDEPRNRLRDFGWAALGLGLFLMTI